MLEAELYEHLEYYRYYNKNKSTANSRNETSKYWFNVLTEIKNRDVKDILIGFVDAIKVIYTDTEIQRCVVHQVRNTLNYISYKHNKEFSGDLKQVYTAPKEENVLSELAILEKNRMINMRYH